MLKYRLKNYFSVIGLVFAIGTATAQSVVDRQPQFEKASPQSMKAGAFIDVNVPPYPQSSWTITQLITDVLISQSGSTGCSGPTVSNVVVSPNLPASDPNRTWGYFNKGTTSFPFNAGILLVTGSASEAGNAYISSTLSGGPVTPSDPDLVAAINPKGALNNTTFIEFDFVPTSPNVKFNYLFASEEYTSNFPCGNFSDGFALLIKNLTTGGGYTNLAVLPGGAGPVSVTNIVPAGSGFSCGPINAAYFAGLNPTNIETNFNGRTIPLTAQTTVVPGNSYHFKMAIADASDSAFNSAVFLEAGSFFIGVSILGPGGVALPSTINMCDNTPQTLTSSVNLPGATYQWTLNGVPIAGATNTTYIATQPGKYCLSVLIPGNVCPSTACIDVIGGTSPTVQNATLTQCYGPANVNFNLTLAQPAICSTSGVLFSYHKTQAEAQAGTNAIVNPLVYSSNGGETIWVRVLAGFCYSVAQLMLEKAPQMNASIATPPSIDCIVSQIDLNATGSIVPPGASVNWTATNGGYIVSGGNTLTPAINSAGTYTLTISKKYQPGDTLCTSTATVTVLEDKALPATGVSASDKEICEGETTVLTASGGVTYQWTNYAGNGSVATVSPTTTTTYQVWAIGANGCKSAIPASITITVRPRIQSLLPKVAGNVCIGDEFTLDAGSHPNFPYTYNWSTGDTTQTIVVTSPGTYWVEIDNGFCKDKFSTEVHLTPLPKIESVTHSDNNILNITATNPTKKPLEYSIDGGTTWQDSNLFYNVPNNVKFIIHVRSKGTKCETIFEYFTFFMSNIITPNGDGQNDVIDLSAISQYPKFSAKIADRYGMTIWEGTDKKAVWDGRFSGKQLTSASYWYYISYEDPASKKLVEKSGWILLKNRD